jgi:branched-chain amino acid transport system ATP-binding protein
MEFITMAINAPVLDAQNISVVFGGLVAVNDVSFTIPEGSIVSLIGPNGAGKTTFFNVLTGLYQPTSGAVIYDGTNITGRAPHKIAASGLARTFQNIRLFGMMTAQENVMVAMHSKMRAGVWSTVLRTRKQRAEEANAKEFAQELLDFVGIGETTHEYARNLSYGDQRRLEVARCVPRCCSSMSPQLA